WDYWVSSVNATLIQRQYCMDRAARRRGYGPNGWGLNAGDSPRGYRVYGGPRLLRAPEGRPPSPPRAIPPPPFHPRASPHPTPAHSRPPAPRARLWGRFGFANAYNVTRSWYDEDVIGIDLGMALLAIENARSGLIWRQMASHPAIERAFAAAGLHVT